MEYQRQENGLSKCILKSHSKEKTEETGRQSIKHFVHHNGSDLISVQHVGRQPFVTDILLRLRLF